MCSSESEQRVKHSLMDRWR